MTILTNLSMGVFGTAAAFSVNFYMYAFLRSLQGLLGGSGFLSSSTLRKLTPL